MTFISPVVLGQHLWWSSSRCSARSKSIGRFRLCSRRQIAIACLRADREPSLFPPVPYTPVLTTILAFVLSGLLSLGLDASWMRTQAATQKLPPIDRNNPQRCVPLSSAIGQANAARDVTLDLRECDLRGKDLSGYDISGALLEKADLQGVKLVDAMMSKAYAPRANFKGADFTNGVIDRVDFGGSDLTGAIFANAVLSDTSFDDAILEDTDFSEAYLGDFAQKRLCKNPTLKGQNPVTGASTRASLGCK